jgi:formylmethanofuran dehydrogenase subunit B
MADAFIDGRPVSIDAAVAEAAKLLALSRLPVIAGLGTDVAGARAAVALAERLGGVIDHLHSDALLRDLDVAREAGMMLTTPNEAALRADTLLLVGPGLVSAWPQLVPRLLARAPDPELADSRRICWLCPGSRRELPTGELVPRIEAVGRDPRHLQSALAALRARVAGRSCARGPISAKALDSLAAGLAAARFGVAIWSPAELDALAIEMLCGLVKDLNATTRFVGLSLLPADNAGGVMQVCGWMSGFPVRIGFGRGYPEHDPWRFDARRLVESGEGDCVLWISAYRPVAPEWNVIVPIIALTSSDTKFRHAPRVLIVTGRPGVDHACVERRADTGTLGCIEAAKQSNAISVAQAIGRIAAALPNDRIWPC